MNFKISEYFLFPFSFLSNTSIQEQFGNETISPLKKIESESKLAALPPRGKNFLLRNRSDSQDTLGDIYSRNTSFRHSRRTLASFDGDVDDLGIAGGSSSEQTPAGPLRSRMSSASFGMHSRSPSHGNLSRSPSQGFIPSASRGGTIIDTPNQSNEPRYSAMSALSTLDEANDGSMNFESFEPSSPILFSPPSSPSAVIGHKSHSKHHSMAAIAAAAAAAHLKNRQSRLDSTDSDQSSNASPVESNRTRTFSEGQQLIQEESAPKIPPETIHQISDVVRRNVEPQVCFCFLFV